MECDRFVFRGVNEMLDEPALLNYPPLRDVLLEATEARMQRNYISTYQLGPIASIVKVRVPLGGKKRRFCLRENGKVIAKNGKELVAWLLSWERRRLAKENLSNTRNA